MALATNEIVIRMEDGTDNRRFSQTNTANDVVRAATQTTTQQATTSGSTPPGIDVMRQVGTEFLGGTQIGSAFSQIKGVATSLMNPVTASLMALTLAKQVYDLWQQEQRERNEWLNTQAIYSGANWQNVNLRNKRTNLITGKITGDRSRNWR